MAHQRFSLFPKAFFETCRPQGVVFGIHLPGYAMTDEFAGEPAPAANPLEAYSNWSEIAIPA
jgi:hypothetical protein